MITQSQTFTNLARIPSLLWLAASILKSRFVTCGFAGKPHQGKSLKANKSE
jgi:hypothetical protein